jgi:CubicO group peptidase (beta-lactamase class C family)
LIAFIHDLETLVRQRVLESLGMTRTSHTCQGTLQANAARPHDESRRPKGLRHRHKPLPEAIEADWVQV